jgi:cytochrome c-type biogenesis protein CcmH/NrfF
MLDSAVPDFKSTEIVLFVGGAVLTLAVFVIAVVLFRMASREHRKQLEHERKERGE